MTAKPIYRRVLLKASGEALMGDQGFGIDVSVADRIAVIETCPDGAAAMQSYQRLHREYPSREFYFVHTGREDLDIRERRWIGVRRADAAYAEG